MNISILLSFGDQKLHARIEPDDEPIRYSFLIRSCRNLFPSLSCELDSTLLFYYRDNNDDSIEVSTDDDLTEAIKVMTEGKRSLYEFKIEKDQRSESSQGRPAIFDLPTQDDKILPQQNIARVDNGGITTKNTMVYSTIEAENDGELGALIFCHDFLAMGDIYPAFGDIKEDSPQKKGLLHKTAYQSSLPRPRSPAEKASATKTAHWPINPGSSPKAGARRPSLGVHRSISPQSNIPDIQQSMRCSNVIFADLGLTIIDVAELLLHRGVRSFMGNHYSESFDNYNGAYKLLYETEISDFAEDEMNCLISSQLQGLTQQSLFADIGNLYILLSVNALKEEGDIMFAYKKFTDASLKYSEAVDLSISNAGCLSNLAACKLAMKDALGCISNATLALATLDTPVGAIRQYCGNNGVASFIYSHIPEDAKKLLRVQSLLRRGAAYAQLRLLDEAVADYRTASMLYPKDQALKGHLNHLLVLKVKDGNLAFPSKVRDPSSNEKIISSPPCSNPPTKS